MAYKPGHFPDKLALCEFRRLSLRLPLRIVKQRFQAGDCGDDDFACSAGFALLKRNVTLSQFGEGDLNFVSQSVGIECHGGFRQLTGPLRVKNGLIGE